ncbi:MAG: alpha/beta hydrolase [Anaerolineae bacterium]|nr:alpha/beta hydrolase [Anaerolineae bacterium]
MFSRLLKPGWLLLLALLLASLPAQAGAPQPTVTLNIAYVPGGTLRQRLDVYRPPNLTAPAPTLILIHGGGYLFGDKLWVRQNALYFASAGYAVVAPGYRLAPAHTYPAQIEDVFCALAWTFTHAAEYGLDQQRIAVVGESAGANAAALLAMVDDPARYLTGCPWALPEAARVRGAVLFYPPLDLSTCACERAKQMAALYLGVDPDALDQEAAVRQAMASASPLAWLDGSEPPVLLVHGTADELIPISEAELLVERLAALAVPVELVPVAGAGHGFFSRVQAPETQRSLALTLDWLAQVLR